MFCEIALQQFTVEYGCNHGAGVRQFDSAACAVGTSAPACIDEPHIGLAFPEFLAEQIGIFSGVQRQERSAKAGGKGGFGLLDSHFRACHACSITADEIVHRLFGSEARDRWQNTISIASQEKDIFGVTIGATGRESIINMVNGIRHPCIFRYTAIGIIYISCSGMELHIFEDSAVPDSPVDIRFLFKSQINCFRIAASFEVEDLIISPGVFIIANQHTFGISRESGFAGARQPEKKCYVAFLTHIGGAVHGQSILCAGWQNEIDNRENTLFDFACVACATDQEATFFYINYGEIMLPGSVCFRVSPESGDTKYRPAGIEIAEYLGVGPQEHITGELITPGILCYNAKAEAVIRVFAGIGSQITHVQIFLVEIATDFAPERVEFLRAEGDVHFAPIYFGGCFAVFDDEPVFR